MKRFAIEIKWAIIFSIVSILWMAGEKLVGLHGTAIDKHELFSNFFAIPAILIFYFAIRDKKINYYHDKMRYMQGLWTGFFITLIITVLNPLTQYIVSSFITPEYFTNMIRYTVDSGQMTQEEANEYFTLSNYIFMGMISSPVLGIVTSAFVSIFARTKTNEY